MNFKQLGAAIGITGKIVSSLVSGTPDVPKQYTDHARVQQQQRQSTNRQGANNRAATKNQPAQHPPKKNK